MLKTFSMNHLLVMEIDDKRLAEMQHEQSIEKQLGDLGLQVNGPMFMQVIPSEEGNATIKYFIPINQAVTLKDEVEFKFIDQIEVDCFYQRIITKDIDEVQAIMEDLHKQIDREGYVVAGAPYQVMLPLYGDMIIDLYLPVKEMELF